METRFSFIVLGSLLRQRLFRFLRCAGFAGVGARAPSATPMMRVPSPAAGHTEFIATQIAAVERVKNRFDFAAQMGADSNAEMFQSPPQRFGKCGAEQYVHMQLRQAPREHIRGLRTQHDFSSLCFFAALPVHEKQA
ncbi:MAG TPA: hypothetical protein GYA07_16220 [Verrucomicrobia bacterium]|nr:hypothetical protein [Verrucomicrobiota bacterium]